MATPALSEPTVIITKLEQQSSGPTGLGFLCSHLWIQPQHQILVRPHCCFFPWREIFMILVIWANMWPSFVALTLTWIPFLAILISPLSVYKTAYKRFGSLFSLSKSRLLWGLFGLCFLEDPETLGVLSRHGPPNNEPCCRNGGKTRSTRSKFFIFEWLMVQINICPLSLLNLCTKRSYTFDTLDLSFQGCSNI